MFKNIAALLFLVILLCGCSAKYKHLDDFLSGKVNADIHYVKEGFQSTYRNIVDISDRCIKEQWDDAYIRSDLYTDIRKGEIIFYVEGGIVAYIEIKEKGDNDSVVKIYCYSGKYIKPETIKKWASGLSVCR